MQAHVAGSCAGNCGRPSAPVSYYDKIMRPRSCRARQKSPARIYANYDLTFPREYSLKVVEAFTRVGLNYEKRVLPCGHYTTGETPFQYMDGWHMGWFVYRAFKDLRKESKSCASRQPHPRP